MKKSNETKRLEEVREEITEILFDWLKDVYEGCENGAIEENIREVSVTQNNNIYDFTFILYMGIADVVFYRCLYFEDLDETLIYEYRKTERHTSLVFALESE